MLSQDEKYDSMLLNVSVYPYRFAPEKEGLLVRARSTS